MASSFPASTAFSPSPLSLPSAVMLRKMTAVVDWIQDDGNRRTVSSIQLVSGVVGNWVQAKWQGELQTLQIALY